MFLFEVVKFFLNQIKYMEFFKYIAGVKNDFQD